MRKIATTALIAAAAVAALGCASTLNKLAGDGPKLDYREYAGDPIDRFTAFDIDSWTPVSRNQLVVWSGVNDGYLLTVWDNCNDLQFADKIAVRQTGYSVSKFDSVQVGRQRCQIKEIRRVDTKRMKLDRNALQAKP
jgi:Family of unknown function (DUF6491)